MQVANERTVLGNFTDVKFSYAGITSTFFRRADRFYVNTDGANGKLQDFEIQYTFGVSPLQQYLVEFPGRRLQALSLAWDSRSKASGGQRWFHLYPNEQIASDDPLHWTGRNQNWNWMCAGCHSTNLKRNYDAANDRYATTWSELNVACEACHGPASNHVTWAKAQDAGVGAEGHKGLTVTLAAARGGGWAFASPDAPTRQWAGTPRSGTEIEVCAACHARRRALADDTTPAGTFLDGYAPALLEEGLYHPDGQILEEDYEYGSFLQSRMHRAGVACSDCHEPHGLELRAEGNALCTRCHQPAKFDRPEHHHHAAVGPGAACVDCHMPAKTYMVIDARRDHSLRVPRPDRSVKFGTPNACTQCHAERPATWAAATVARWYGSKRRQETGFVAALDAGRGGRAEAEGLLAALAMDGQQAGIARATALAELAPYLSARSFPAVESGARDQDALVRLGAVQALRGAPPKARQRALAPLLDDPLRAVRVAAARVLAGEPEVELDAAQRTRFERALAEFIATEKASAERPESHLNLAALQMERGQIEAADRELETALRLDPSFVPALVNLADLRRAQGRDAEGESLLLRAMNAAPEAAEPTHALGLLRVRQHRLPDALGLLQRAAELQPNTARYGYVYGVALQSSGDLPGAERVLEGAHARRPADREVLVALINIERTRGAQAEAREHAEQLVRLAPDDPIAMALLMELRRSTSELDGGHVPGIAPVPRLP
ncbi:MAG: tetratricopeptide repeat protein [Rhodospirillales bacterium]|nr:tetratricopeptide repeat protein [Rhodospirillales bacterium]